jgi:hypothetical protein
VLYLNIGHGIERLTMSAGHADHGVDVGVVMRPHTMSFALKPKSAIAWMVSRSRHP